MSNLAHPSSTVSSLKGLSSCSHHEIKGSSWEPEFSLIVSPQAGQQHNHRVVAAKCPWRLMETTWQSRGGRVETGVEKMKRKGQNKVQSKSDGGSRKGRKKMVAMDCHSDRSLEGTMGPGPSINSSQDGFYSIQLWEQIQACP